MTDTASAPTAAEVSAVITRACSKCRSPRTAGEDCTGCGNTTPAQQVNLGVVSAAYRNPLRRGYRALVGAPLARWRTIAANASSHAEPAEPDEETS